MAAVQRLALRSMDGQRTVACADIAGSGTKRVPVGTAAGRFAQERDMDAAGVSFDTPFQFVIGDTGEGTVFFPAERSAILVAAGSFFDRVRPVGSHHAAWFLIE